MWQVLLDGLSALSENWFVTLGAVGVICLGCSLSLFPIRETTREKAIPWQGGFLLVSLFVISLLLRLAFLTGIFVPPYFDSVEHYRIIKELVTALQTSTLLEIIPTLTPSYYHLGFHFLASFLAFGLRADPTGVILVLGQVILAAIPIPIFFLIRQETYSDAAAFLGTLLAGFGWYMPGFAVNWGKYPALVGLLALGLVLNIAHWISQKRVYRNQYAAFGLLILGVLVSTFFHSRTLVVIAIASISWLIAGRVRSFPKLSQYVLLGGLLSGILIFGFIVQKEPLLKLTLEPYLSDGIWVTLIVVALSSFAFVNFPRGFYFNILFTLFILAALFIPIGNWFLGIENQTLLDRPFVEMMLYLPLSILGGLGLAGLSLTLNKVNTLPDRIRSYIKALAMILFIGFAGMIPIVRYDFYSSDCCNFVAYDDTVALDWLDKKLPPDARILTASTQLNVLPSGPTGLVGTDAGIWIPALTNRNITLVPFDIDFRAMSTLEQLCQEQIDYVYVGSTDQKFNATQLQTKPEWYEGVLFLPDVKLYQLTGCSK